MTTIQTKLAAVMDDVQAVAKSDRNTHQNFAFRGIDAVLNAVGPALRRHGVVVVPDVTDYRYETVEVGQKRTQMGHAIVRVAYTFSADGVDGSLTCSVLGEAMDSGDKAIPKAMSVAFRTALLQALALPTDEPDPDASTYERAAGRDPVAAAADDAELQELLTLAEDLVDRVAVVAFASRGPAELASSKARLREKLDQAATATA